jgi:ABC-2 type transport system permease protein
MAPLVVFFRDLERAIKLILRLLFYASPIVYSATDVPHGLRDVIAFNPLTGIFSLYRAAFFSVELNWATIGVSAAMSIVLLVIGLLVFSRAQRAVLKEI